MPRGGKRGGHLGNSHRGSRGSPRSGRQSFVQSSGVTARHRGFTLAEEARNTQELQQAWNPDRQLRHNNVSFVSAGYLAKPEEKEAESALANMSLNSPPTYPEDGEDSQQDVPIKVEVEVELDNQFSSGTTENLDFVIDTHGDKSLGTRLLPHPMRSGSPSPSNSSEEVILFGGRDNKGNGISRYAMGPNSLNERASILDDGIRQGNALSGNADRSERARSTESLDARIRIVEDRIHMQEELLGGTLHGERSNKPPQHELNTPPTYEGFSSNNSDGFEAVVFRRKNKKRGQRGGQRHKQEAAEEEAILADYLANMDSEDKEVLASTSGFNIRQLGGTNWSDWQETEMVSREFQMSKEHLKSGWDSNIEDLDDLSTSDGVMGEVQGIVSKRERRSGTQYLVIWEDLTMDEARWVPATTLTSVSAQAQIEAFEAEEKLVAEFRPQSDDDDDDSVDGEDTTDDDEADLLQRRAERMDDEQIARLLAKQEELGMGSNELLLFDEAHDPDNDFTLPGGTLHPLILPQKKTPSKRPKGEFPAATALADAYDGFDIMDFERPSLKKKPKGRKGKLILDDVDDSELEESMQAAWDNDRIKKKERRQEREDLRAQGLLGKKNGKPDLKQKYKAGMGIRAVKEEIKIFLMSNHASLALPPMDKEDRKIVHEIANAFKLKSKSVGNGNDRAPVLIRTARTMAYIERYWDQVDAQTSRGFLPRLDLHARRSGKKPGRAAGGGFSSAAVSYRDGETVGASAPELGAENRGRAMLEKMGWSKGTALGALNNKGILEPVSHVVKTTRAGLG